MARSLEARILDLLEISDGSALSPEQALVMLDLRQLIDVARETLPFIGYDSRGADRMRPLLAAVVSRAIGEVE